MSERSKAQSAWCLFHKRDDPDWTKEIALTTPFPQAWGLVGRCVTTYYSSDKWQSDRSFFERYYHDHSKKTQIWLPEGSGVTQLLDTPPPDETKTPAAVAVLGFALGFDTESPTHEKGKLKPESGALLVYSPTKNRLYVLEGAQITALIWGPKMIVSPRGIIG